MMIVCVFNRWHITRYRVAFAHLCRAAAEQAALSRSPGSCKHPHSTTPLPTPPNLMGTRASGRCWLCLLSFVDASFPSVHTSMVLTTSLRSSPTWHYTPSLAQLSIKIVYTSCGHEQKNTSETTETSGCQITSLRYTKAFTLLVCMCIFS